MKKLLLIWVFIGLLFFLPNNSLRQDIAHAGITAPTSLVATSSCYNGQALIAFRWITQVTDGTSFGQYFWKTGDTEIDVTKSAGPGIGPNSYSLVQYNVSQGKVFDWKIRVHDNGFCLFDCDKTTNGPQITSDNCSLPECEYFYTDWSACVNGQQTRTFLIPPLKPPGGCNGDPILSQGCSTPATYNCSTPSPGCNRTDYPTCVTFPYSPISSNCNTKCDYCRMINLSGTDQSKWTESCAYSNKPCECLKDGEIGCTGMDGAQGDCCAGLECQAPNPGKAAVNNGTCSSVHRPCVGPACPLTGTPPLPTSSRLPTPTGIQYGGEFGGAVTDYNCGSGKNDVWTLGCVIPTIASIVAWLIAFAAAISVIFIIYASIRIIVARGDPKSIAEGKKVFEFAIIGLLIVFLSFFILRFIASTTGVACIDPRRPLTFTSCR